jgi:peptidoglycan/LPS O-acetylase OafA/YrhL
VTKRRYRSDVDGLRAIAVVSVVFFHAQLPFVQGGFVGVDIFFVISGYLINGVILRSAQTGTFSYAEFYARRARRILPALIFVVTTSCIAGWFLLSASEYREMGSTALSALVGTSNITFWRFQDYFAPDARLAPLLMTWSLGVEEQFYLIIPTLTLLLSRGAATRGFAVLACVGLASLVFSVWCTGAYPTVAFYLLPARAWELAAGGLLAASELIWANRAGSLPLSPRLSDALGWTGLALVAIAIFGLKESVPFPGVAALLPVIGTVALIAADGSFVNRRLLGTAPLRFIGLVSYSWYLWHWPLIAYLRVVAVTSPPAQLLVVAAFVALGLAVLTWRFIEQPFRQGKLKARPVLVRYALALTMSVALPAVIKFGHGLPFRLPATTSQIEGVLAAGRGDCLAPWGLSHPDLSPDCRQEKPGRPTIALIGDSHAAALGPGLREVAKGHDNGFAILTKANCLPLSGVALWAAAHPSLAQDCAVFMRETLDLIIADPAMSTVVLAGSWDTLSQDLDLWRFVRLKLDPDAPQDVLLRSGLQSMVQQIVASGKMAIVVGDVPKFTFDVGRYAVMRSMRWRMKLAAMMATTTPNSTPDFVGEASLIRRSPRAVEMVEMAAREGGGIFVDLYDCFCSELGCEIADGGQPLFVDTNHLSTLGSQAAIAKLLP